VSTQRTTPSDLEIALFLQREKHRLPKQYRGLVDRTVRYLKDSALVVTGAPHAPVLAWAV
jgi:hypothetical protein